MTQTEPQLFAEMPLYEAPKNKAQKPMKKSAKAPAHQADKPVNKPPKKAPKKTLVKNSKMPVSLGDVNSHTPPKAGNAWRRLTQKIKAGQGLLRHPVRAPDQLALIPPDPWPGNAAAGRLLLQGVAQAGGQVFPLAIDTHTPLNWLPAQAGPDWFATMHRFDWLRDLRAVGGDQARRLARGLVADWLHQYSTWHQDVWRPDLCGQRIAAILGVHDFFLSSADDKFRRQVFAACQVQLRFLAQVLPGQLRGVRLLAALKGLLLGQLAFGWPPAKILQTLAWLHDALSQQLLPDGGQLERNPSSLVQVLRHLLDIRASLRAAGFEVADNLHNTIHAMAPLVRSLMHGDGKLACFNGASEEDSVLLDLVLHQAHAGARAANQQPHFGYERLQAGRTLVLVDMAASPPMGYDTQAHGAPLAFELSVGRERLLVNCGHGGTSWPGQPFNAALRTTAAHNSLVLADCSAVPLNAQGGLARHCVVEVMNRTQADTHTRLLARHDGYLSQFGLWHTREWLLAVDGEELQGIDALSGTTEGQAYAVRFHLHPEVRASLTPTGVLLRLRSGAGWRFKASHGEVSLEESIYVANAGDKPRPTTQIVITGFATDQPTLIKWYFWRDKKPHTKAAT